MKRRARIALGLLGAGAILAAATPLYERFLGRPRLRFFYLTGELPVAEYQALAQRPGWHASQLPVADGISLHGLVRRPSAPTAPWVIYFPGNDAQQLKVGQQFLTRLAGGADWGLSVFAYRGFNSSDGVPHVEQLALDASTLLERLYEQEHIDPENAHLVGFSIGGHMAVHAARTPLKGSRAARSLTLLASVDDIVMVRPSPWQRLDPGDDYQTRPLLPEVPGPVLVLQGTDDAALGGPGQGRAIAKALGGRADYHEFVGVAHSPLLEYEPGIEITRQFILDSRAAARVQP